MSRTKAHSRRRFLEIMGVGAGVVGLAIARELDAIVDAEQERAELPVIARLVAHLRLVVVVARIGRERQPAVGGQHAGEDRVGDREVDQDPADVDEGGHERRGRARGVGAAVGAVGGAGGAGGLAGAVGTGGGAVRPPCRHSGRPYR